MFQFLGISRSGYAALKRLGQRTFDSDLIDIISEQQNACDRADGYRRIGAQQKRRCGVAAPQRPKVSVHLTSILNMGSHRLCHDEESSMTTSWRRISFRSSSIYRHFPATFDDGRTRLDLYIYFYDPIEVKPLKQLPLPKGVQASLELWDRRPCRRRQIRSGPKAPQVRSVWPLWSIRAARAASSVPVWSSARGSWVRLTSTFRSSPLTWAAAVSKVSIRP